MAASVAAVAVSFATLDAFAFPIVSGLTFLMIGCIGAAYRFARDQGAEAAALTEGNIPP
jgi:polysaccharide biosynthesis protein PslJ